MATYTKETALYDTGAIASGIENAAGTATNYITYVDSTNGIRVYDGQSGNKNKNFAQVNATGMQVYQGGAAEANKVASFGANVQVGKQGVGYTTLASTGMDIYAGSSNVQLAHIGYASGEGESGTSNAPYYTFGTRESDTDDTRGNYSFAEGYEVTASGFASHAEGDGTTASGYRAHAEGSSTTASGVASHAEGGGTTASGVDSHAEGGSTTALGDYSHASGLGTKARRRSQFVIGEFNVEETGNPSTKGTHAFLIGSGSSDSSRHNAFAVDWGGIVRVNNDIYVGCDSDSTGGTKLVRQTRTINGYALSSNIALDASDVNAIANNKIACGTTGAVTIAANSTAYIDVSFGKTFPSTPIVVCSLYSTSTAYTDIGKIRCWVTSVSTTGCRIYFYNQSSSQRAPAAHWHAIAI